jgi:glycosyltransferase involved in cell wall biosynthesis
MTTPRPLNVAAFTQGQFQPSSRFRVRQLVDALVEDQICIHEFVAPTGSYPPFKGVVPRTLWGLKALVSRIPAVVESRWYDAVLLQRELVATLATLEPFTGRPRILDADDAIWLNRRVGGADRIAQLVDLVVAGNAFLADHFQSLGCRVVTIPTSVDTLRFTPGPRVGGEEIVIGWSGTSGGFPFLYAIEGALCEVMRRHPEARLHVVADKAPNFTRLKPEQWRFIQWSEELEAPVLRTFDVGIMPLFDDDWCRGKCSFKMLTYMATGVPVVASPVGMNGDIFSQAAVGLPAQREDEWVDALSTLISQPAQRGAFGLRGKALVDERYSVRIVSKQLAAAIRSVV